MTLAPMIYFLNHTCNQAEALKVDTKLSTGITVSANQSYEPGQELQIFYGPHENGFLLVEYGFVVSDNIWNFADVTPAVKQLVPEKYRQWLIDHKYRGDYTISPEGEPSFRVDVALAAAHDPGTRVLQQFIDGTVDSSRFPRMTELVREMLVLARHEPPFLPNELYEEHIGILSKTLLKTA